MKKTIAILNLALLVMFSSNAFSQVPAFYQPSMFGDPGGNEMIKASVGDSDGNLYVVGSFSGTSFSLGSATLTNNGMSDVFIAKYNRAGAFVWAESAGGTEADTATGIAKDSHGNIYMVGNFRSSSITFGTTSLTNNGSFTNDMFIVKFDPAGGIIWAHSAGGSDNDYVAEIAIDHNFNMYITGNFNSSTVAFGSSTVTNISAGSPDIFYTKMDTSGTVIWANSAGSSFDEHVSAITVDTADIYITGSFFGPSITFGTFPLTNNGNENIFVTKINAAGTVLWAQGFGNTGSERGVDIKADNSNHVFLTGSFSSYNISFGSSTFMNQGPPGSFDIFTVKFTYGGTISWARGVGSNGDEIVSCINRDGCDYIYVCGTFNSTSPITFAGSPLNFSVGNEMLILKYDESGNEVWGKSAYGNNDDHGTCVSGNVDGNIIVAGYSNSAPLTFDTNDINNSAGAGGTYDFFLTRIQTTATDIYAYITNLGMPLTDGKVYLYGRQNNYAVLFPVDSAILTSTGIAHFANVLNLNYEIRVNADTTLFPLAIPTYNGNVYMWDSVNTWPHSCSTNDTIYISMIQQTNSGLGNGKISGYVTKTAFYAGMSATNGNWNRAQGDPVQGIDVKIRHNPGGASVAATTTDVLGYYYFTNVDTGSYTILIDIPGLGRDSSYTLQVTPTDTLFLQNNYVADSDYIFISNLPVGIIKPAEHSSRISVAPNPFSNATVITFGEKQTRTVLRITNALGTEIKSVVVSNENKYILEKGDMTKGIYFIQITDENKNVTNRKIVIQ